MIPLALAGIGALALMSNPFKKSKGKKTKRADAGVSRKITGSEWAYIKSLRAGRASKSPAVTNPRRYGEKLTSHKLSGAEWRIIRGQRKRMAAMRKGVRAYTPPPASAHASLMDAVGKVQYNPSRADEGTDIRQGPPRVVRAPTYASGSLVRYAIAGTAYGYLHNTAGEIRMWRTRSAARKRLAQGGFTLPRDNPFRNGKSRSTKRPVGTIFKRKGRTWIVTRTRNGRAIARRWSNKHRK